MSDSDEASLALRQETYGSFQIKPVTLNKCLLVINWSKSVEPLTELLILVQEKVNLLGVNNSFASQITSKV